MDGTSVDWTIVDRLRRRFLEGGPGGADYWQGREDLDVYDRTFGRRIAWKWDYVLAGLAARGWAPPPGTVLDWGCGTGVAARTFLARFGPASVGGLDLWDRSREAQAFAAEAARAACPGLSVTCGRPGAGPVGTLLVSHVITELAPAALEGLADVASRASAIVWVEAGTREAARALMGVRDRLRDRFHVVAPCTHGGPCGLRVAGRERDWCHHFAPSPAEAFRERSWARFARIAGVDLRSLPLAYLVLDRRPAPPLPPGTVRVLGRPRVSKAQALLLGCDAEGVRAGRFAKRSGPETFRRLKRGEAPALQVWACEAGAITSLVVL